MSQTNNPSMRGNYGSHNGATESTTAAASSTTSTNTQTDLTYNINRYLTSPKYSTPPFHREKIPSYQQTSEPSPQDELAKELENMEREMNSKR